MAGEDRKAPNALDEAMREMTEAMRRPGSRELLEAFLSIPDPAVRAGLVELVTAIAAGKGPRPVPYGGPTGPRST